MGTPIFEAKKVDLCSLSRDSPLDNWFYNLVQKEVDSLTDFDISRMLRQDIYLDIAIPQALKRMTLEPFCGPMYNGQMMKNFLEVAERGPIKLRKEPYISLAKNICRTIENFSWNDFEEADELIILARQFYKLFGLGHQG